MQNVQLDQYNNSWYKSGRSTTINSLWYYHNIIFLKSSLLPFKTLKTSVLRLFGARIGKNVTIKPGVNVKYPWNVKIGKFSWIGENVWMDSLEKISIGNNVCISQGVYLCTGNHDWNDPAFGLIVEPIDIENGAWIGAHSIILPGVTVSSHSVITAGSVVSQNTEAYMIYSGNPAVKIKERIIR